MTDLEKSLLQNGYVVELRMRLNRVTCKIGVENGRKVSWYGVGFGQTKDEAIKKCIFSLPHATEKATH